jgi:hypothetical protein
MFTEQCFCLKHSLNNVASERTMFLSEYKDVQLSCAFDKKKLGVDFANAVSILCIGDIKKGWEKIIEHQVLLFVVLTVTSIAIHTYQISISC